MSAADRRADVKYWRLTNLEQVHYYGRISAYYGRRAAASGERAIRHGRTASKLAAVQVGLWGGLALIFIGKLAGWWA